MLKIAARHFFWLSGEVLEVCIVSYPPTIPTCSILLGFNCRRGASHLHETTSVGSAALAKASNLLQPMISKRDRRNSDPIA